MRSYMFKRFLDLLMSASVLILTSPLLIGVMIAVWLEFVHQYIAPRVLRAVAANSR